MFMTQEVTIVGKSLRDSSVRRSSSMHKRLRVREQKWQAKTESSERGTVEEFAIALLNRRACRTQ